jgi:hypothetical protein
MPLDNEKERSAPVEILFSGSGGLFAYQLGVAAYIKDHFDLSNCIYSGSSGGAWIAMIMAADLCPYRTGDVMKQLTFDHVGENPWFYQGYGIFSGIMHRVNMQLFQEKYSNEQHALKIVHTNRLCIALTRFPSLKAERHKQWDNVIDLSQAVVASSLVPFFMSGRPCIRHRGKWYFDGCITNFKGVNCEKYHTLKDVFFHIGQLLLDFLRYTLVYISKYLFPILTSPIAAFLYNKIPASLTSPNEVIMSRKTTPTTTERKNGGARTKDYSLTQPKGRNMHHTHPGISHRHLSITPWRWRRPHLKSFLVPLDVEESQIKFDNGYADAHENFHEIAAVIPPLTKPKSSPCSCKTPHNDVILLNKL